MDAEVEASEAKLHEAFAGFIEERAGEYGAVLTCRSGTFLPGYYRPTVRWPVGVYSGDTLAAVVGMSSEPWPSLAMNFGPVVEEAIASATDLRHAYQEGLLGTVMPLACYYTCIEDHLESRLMGPVSGRDAAVNPAFADLTYRDAYRVFCQRLMATGHYDVVCYATRDRTDLGGPFRYPDPELTFAALVARISSHVSQLPKWN